MRVRYVRRHVPSGSDVAVLGPAESAERPMIALTVSRPEALELAEELEQRPTPRTGVYNLLVSILGSAGASVTSIEVQEAPGQAAQARLELTGPNGRSEIQVEVGQAISLSVRIGQPVHVAEELIEAVTPPALGAASETRAPLESTATEPVTAERAEPSSAHTIDVPDQFRRAFDEQ
jgi:bifunctional DNase/RNase